MQTSAALRVPSVQWVSGHDVMLSERSAEHESRDSSDVRYKGGEHDAPPRRPHHRATTNDTNDSGNAYFPPRERNDHEASASSDEFSRREHEYEPNKTSLGFIMNGTAVSAAPPPSQNRPLYSRPPSREPAGEAMPHAAVPTSSLFRPASARPPVRSIHSVNRSADLGTVYREVERDTARLQLPPPLESRRRAVSTRSSAATDEAAEMLIRVAQTARPTKKKTEKKRRATTTTKTASKTMSYGEKRRSRECKIDGCENYIINKGLCFRHGGGKKCSEEGCTSSAKNAGKCWKHGGSVKCLVDGCERRGKSRGLCWAHGGGTKCLDTSCSKVAVSNGFCWAHGGGKRCAYEDCKKAAYERTYNYCFKHHDQLKDGSETLEV